MILKVNIGSIEGASIDARGELVPDPTAEREVTDSKAARDLEKGEHCSTGLFVQRESAWAAAKIGISGRDCSENVFWRVVSSCCVSFFEVLPLHLLAGVPFFFFIL